MTVDKRKFNFIDAKVDLLSDRLELSRGIVQYLNYQESKKLPQEIIIADIEYCDIKEGSILERPKIIVRHNNRTDEIRFNKGLIGSLGKFFNQDGLKEAKQLVDRIKPKNNETSKVSNDSISKSGDMKKEYKRTCKECGEVWHVLSEREEKVEKQMKANQVSQAGATMMCCFPLAMLSQSNAQDNDSELEKMRSCPECGSHNYDEETIRYEK